MGNNEYQQLPQYIAVQISPERWQIAELFGEEHRDGYRAPTYRAQPKKFTQGECNNNLCELQQKARVL